MSPRSPLSFSGPRFKTGTRKVRALLGLLMLVAFAWNGCAHRGNLPDWHTPGPSSLSANSAGQHGTLPAGRAVTVHLRAAIRALPAGRNYVAGYSRDLFHLWAPTDRAYCDVRDAVLIAESLVPAQVSHYCDITGRWHSYYDDVTTADPSTFQIDHLVPLAEAWASGAWAWSSQRRDAYANDLGDPRTLVAVTAHANESKSDSDPAHWLPLHGRCRYVRDWVAVKIRWSLRVDSLERTSLALLAAHCPDATLHVRRVG